MAGVSIIVQSPSDDLAAWIGLVGVAVGVLLTTGVEWLRDRRTQRRENHRALREAVDELTDAAQTVVMLLMNAKIKGAQSDNRLDFVLALAANLGRSNAAAVTVIRLGSSQLADAAVKVRQAAVDMSTLAGEAELAAAYNKVTAASNNLYAALAQQDV